MTIFDPDAQAGNEMRRQQAIDEAVRAADEIILEASDGSREETDYLTAQVTKKFMEKTINLFTMKILQKDLGV